MALTRREALRNTGLAAATSLVPATLTSKAGAVPSPSGGAAAVGSKRPWYELGLMGDPVLDDVLLFYLSATWQRQADIGEVLDTAGRITRDDEWSWAREWTKTADRLHQSGRAIERRGHRLSAGETLMRASTYYRAALHRWPAPRDPRVRRLTRRAVSSFASAVALLELPAHRVRIPYESTSLPGWFFEARTPGGERRRDAPLLIIHEGRDAWAEDCLHLADGATRRGIHCLLFDGPGQGKVLRLQGLPLRPDWERVVTPVVDFAIAQRGVDPHRLALMGLSMGGALAPRAAAFEPRLKILVANPGVLNWAQLTRDTLRGFVGAELVDLLDRDPAAFDARLARMMKRSAFLRWGVTDLMWKHGRRSPSDTLRSMKAYDNRDSVERIRARTLVMDGAADPWAQGRQLFRALRAPKDYMRFTAQDTGLAHVQNGALGVSSQRLFDWLEPHL
jgi:hypothetical protein